MQGEDILSVQWGPQDTLRLLARKGVLVYRKAMPTGKHNIFLHKNAEVLTKFQHGFCQPKTVSLDELSLLKIPV